MLLLYERAEGRLGKSESRSDSGFCGCRGGKRIFRRKTLLLFHKVKNRCCQQTGRNRNWCGRNVLQRSQYEMSDRAERKIESDCCEFFREDTGPHQVGAGCEGCGMPGSEWVLADSSASRDSDMAAIAARASDDRRIAARRVGTTAFDFARCTESAAENRLTEQHRPLRNRSIAVFVFTCAESQAVRPAFARSSEPSARSPQAASALVMSVPARAELFPALQAVD